MKKMLFIVLLVFCSISTAYADDSDKATVQDVYNLVLKAYEVVKTLGDEALVAFNDPKGEFTYKDTYVYVLNCGENITLAAHPYVMKDAKDVILNDRPHAVNSCEAGKKASGCWIEYNYTKPGEKEPSRKVNFCITIEGTPYTVVAGIFDDNYTIEELNGTLK